MKSTHRLFAFLLCLIMLLGTGCADTPEDTQPQLPVAEAAAQYEAAMKSIQNAADLQVQVTYAQQRNVNGQVYTQNHTYTAAYSGRGTDHFAASIEEALKYGTYEAAYIEQYKNGTAYAQVQELSFAAPMTPAEFENSQIPALLIDPALYAAAVTEQADGGTKLIYTVPNKLEHWVTDCDTARLTTATGTVLLDENGQLLSSTYCAEYFCGSTSYILEVTATPAVNTGKVAVTVPEDSTALTYFEAPKAILQAVGDVYTAQNITASYTDEIYNEILATARTQESTFDIYGSGKEFMAKQAHKVSVTDYTNTPSTNTQVFTFKDGQCSTVVNGGKETPVDDMTAEQMRISCEDSILTAVMALKFLSGAAVTETEEALRIDLTGNDAFAKELSSKIFKLFQMLDPQDYATCETKLAAGYLCIDRHTGLPTAMGLSMERSYVMDNVTYTLRYTLDQAVTLSSTTAYESITNAP